jgi:hypothetical protein
MHAPQILRLVHGFSECFERNLLLAMRPPERRLHPVPFGESSDVARGVSPKGATRCDALRAPKQPLLTNADHLADVGEPLPHNSHQALGVLLLFLQRFEVADQLQQLGLLVVLRLLLLLFPLSPFCLSLSAGAVAPAPAQAPPPAAALVCLSLSAGAGVCVCAGALLLQLRPSRSPCRYKKYTTA